MPRHWSLHLALSLLLSSNTFNAASAFPLSNLSSIEITDRATVAGVSGRAQGFASGTTGGAGGRVVYPSSNSELVSYLSSSETLTVVLTKQFDFTGTEGTTTATGCAPFGTAAGCQTAINAGNWCNNYQPNAPKVPVTYDNAAINPMTITSNKSLIGQGKNGVIKGKGIKIAGGTKNVIVQNIAITGLNPQYVWGGDAITLDGSDRVWIDHVTTSLIGRQHYVSGFNTNTHVTISNCDIDGNTPWSATCNGHHYWAMYFTGSKDTITLQNNYIRNTSGRSPKLADSVLIHAVNNYWLDNSGHAFEGDTSYTIVEGAVFQNVNQPLDAQFSGQMFASTGTTAACQGALGRSCQANIFGSSGPLSEGETGFFGMFKGLSIAPATAATTAQRNVPQGAGYGTI